jgi:diguanylate cyclase (GGDEF)-like protein
MPNADYKSRLAEARRLRVMNVIETMQVLPTAIHVPARIMQLYRSPKAPPIEAFAEVLIADASLSSKVLELANSAWFCPSKPITRVSEALKRIGLNNLLPLLFGLSLAGIFNKADLAADERTAMWQTALLKGMLARQWAKWRKIDQQEEAFLCGVLQDIALPAMIAADRSASPELSGVIDLGDEARAEREALLYGADHAGFGGIICNRLNLYVQATATHHAPRGPVLPEEYRGITPGLQLAAAVPHAMTRLDEHSARHLAECFGKITNGASPAEFAEFIRETSESGKAMMSVLCPQDRAKSLMKDFLQDVSDQIAKTMFNAIGTSTQTIEQLQASQAELEQKIRELSEQIIRADYDPLTNLLNRRGFVDRADKLLALARKLRMGCAVGFIDMAEFQEFNDDHGTDAGDAALVACGKALCEMMQNRGMVGRCGNDDFAFILVVPPEFGQQAVAKEVDQAIGKFSITWNDEPIPVRSFVGLAWLGIPSSQQNILSAMNVAEHQSRRVKKAA